MPTSALPTGRRLGLLFLGYLSAVVAVITLAPFRFAKPDAFDAAWVVLDGGWATDIVLNVVLFVPLGVLWHRSLGMTTIGAALAGGTAGAAIECAQLFLAPRYTTASDLLANGAGAAIGAALSAAIARRIASHAVVSRLWLDQPLVGLVYLLLPLLWLDGLAAAGAPERLWLLVPIASAGALAIAAVASAGDRHGAPGLFGPVAAATTWFAVGAVPALRISPGAALRGVGAAVLVTLVGLPLWRATLARERRLEPQVVRAILPLLLIVATGTALGSDPLDRGAGEVARVTILQLLEQLAVFTLLGYLVAESRGRREEPLMRLIVPALLVAAGVIAALAVTLAPWPSATRPAGCLAAAAVGAILYEAQRAHVLALRAAA